METFPGIFIQNALKAYVIIQVEYEPCFLLESNTNIGKKIMLNLLKIKINGTNGHELMVALELPL